MAKKPERLTTEDDIKILNSFMSSMQDQSNPLDESAKINAETEKLGDFNSQVDNINLRMNMHHKNHPSMAQRTTKIDEDKPLHKSEVRARKKANNAPINDRLAQKSHGQYVAPTEL